MKLAQKIRHEKYCTGLGTILLYLSRYLNQETEK